MVNQDDEPSKDVIKINTVPTDAELAREYQKQLHRVVSVMIGGDGIGLGPTLPILRNEVSYVESMLNNTITIERMLPEWLSNFSVNYPKHFINRCNSHEILGKIVKHSSLVVGGGPSVDEYFNLEPIEEYQGTIICTNKSYKRLLEHNVEPDYVAVLHGTDDILPDFTPRWITDSMSKGKTRFVLATTIHPTVADQICKFVPDDNIIWFNPSISAEMAPNYDMMLSKMSGLPTAYTGGNVGIFSTILATNLGAKTVGMYGLEHCQTISKEWNNETAYNMEIRYAPEECLMFAMSPAFRSYIKQFYQFITNNPNVQFVNLVKNGIFYVDRKKLNIPYMDMREFVNKYD